MLLTLLPQPVVLDCVQRELVVRQRQHLLWKTRLSRRALLRLGRCNALMEAIGSVDGCAVDRRAVRRDRVELARRHLTRLGLAVLLFDKILVLVLANVKSRSATLCSLSRRCRWSTLEALLDCISI